MKDLLKLEPVRVYSVVVALVALAGFYLPSDAWPFVLGIVAAILGVGNSVRARVTPVAKDVPEVPERTPVEVADLPDEWYK